MYKRHYSPRVARPRNAPALLRGSVEAVRLLNRFQAGTVMLPPAIICRSPQTPKTEGRA